MIFDINKGVAFRGVQRKGPLSFLMNFVVLAIFIIILVPLLLIALVLFAPYLIYKKIKGEPIFDPAKIFKVYEGQMKQQQKTEKTKEENNILEDEGEVKDVKFEKKD